MYCFSSTLCQWSDCSRANFARAKHDDSFQRSQYPEERHSSVMAGVECDVRLRSIQCSPSFLDWIQSEQNRVWLNLATFVRLFLVCCCSEIYACFFLLKLTSFRLSRNAEFFCVSPYSTFVAKLRRRNYYWNIRRKTTKLHRRTRIAEHRVIWSFLPYENRL